MAPRHGHTGRFSTFQVILGIWAVIGLVILLAVLFAPRTPPPPPPSELSYEERPERHKDADWGNGSSVFARRDDEPEVDPAQDGGTGKFVVYGAVTDSRTGKPVPYAYVSCARFFTEEEQAQRTAHIEEAVAAGENRSEVIDRLWEERTKRSGATRKNGRYVYRVPSPGHYRVRVWRNGYLHLTEDDAPVVLVDEENPKVRVDVQLTTGAAVSGCVYEEGSRKGIGHVEIGASGGAHSTIRTGKDGTYTLTGLVPGTYEVALNLHDQPYRAHQGIPVRTVIIKEPEEEVTGVDFELEAAGTVWGYVLGPDRKPVTGSDVVLCTSKSVISQAIDALMKQALPMGDSSDKNGYFELVGVPLNKEFRLYSLSKELAPQLTDPFILTKAQRTAHIDVFLFPGTTVYGRVQSTDGTPIPRADVICIPGYSKFFQKLDTAQAVRETHSDQNGVFIIEDLPIGEYQVMAQEEGFKIGIQGERVFSDGFNDVHNVVVTLTPVDSGDHSVYGQVTDARGRAVEGAYVSLAGMGTQTLAAANMNTKTDAWGQFGFVGVEPGLLVLVVEKDGYSTKTVENVRLDESIRVVLDASSSVRGKVLVRETGAAPDHYSVRAIPTGTGNDSGNLMQFLSQVDTLNYRGFRNADGSFQLSLPAGSYTLEARAHEYTNGKASVEVGDGEQVDGITIYVSESGGRIEGHVRTTTGKSPAGAVVTISGQSDPMGAFLSMAGVSERKGYKVLDDGYFEFDSLPEGTYVCTAKLSSYAQGRSGSIQLAEGGTERGVTITLSLGGSLQGYVASNGMNQPGAHVAVFCAEAAVSKYTTADHNGQYSIEGLTPGVYRATAIPVNSGALGAISSARHARVQIQDGQTTIHNFGDEEGATILGLCTPAPSAPGAVLLWDAGAPRGIQGLGINQLLNPEELLGSLGGGALPVSGGLVNTNGEFDLTNVPAGDYVLDVYYADNMLMALSGLKPAHSQALHIDGTETLNMELKISTSGE